MTHACWLLHPTEVFPIWLSVMVQTHKMHFDFFGVVVLQVLDYMEFFETKFPHSFVYLLVTVQKMDHRDTSSYWAGGFFNSLRSQE